MIGGSHQDDVWVQWMSGFQTCHFWGDVGNLMSPCSGSDSSSKKFLPRWGANVRQCWPEGGEHLLFHEACSVREGNDAWRGGNGQVTGPTGHRWCGMKTDWKRRPIEHSSPSPDGLVTDLTSCRSSRFERGTMIFTTPARRCSRSHEGTGPTCLLKRVRHFPRY